jgi:hypothetical protein
MPILSEERQRGHSERRRHVSKSWWQDRPRRRKVLTAVLLAAAIAILCTGILIWWKRTEPYRIMSRYVRAVEDRDTETLFELSDPSERDTIGLTRAALDQMVRALYPDIVKRGPIATNFASHILERKEGNQYHFHVSWIDRKTGGPLDGLRRRGKDYVRMPARCFVVVTPTPVGYRVRSSVFLSTTSTNRWGYILPYVAAARDAGVTGLSDRDGKITLLADIRPASLVPPEERGQKIYSAAP